jgi:GTP pyrophosphokinase/guanosine-3',5'-bis(diphosphate) 3'-pyrophosphohydrolase
LNWQQLVSNSGSGTLHDLFTDIGLGKRVPAVVARLLLAREEMPSTQSTTTLAIHGTEGMAIQLASCCQPIPGDPIVGAIRKGHGLVVHTVDCPNIVRSRQNEPGKWMHIEWEPEKGKLFAVSIHVGVKDKRGVLAQVAATITRADANIVDVSMGNPDEHVFSTLNFTIEVADRVHLEEVTRALQRLPEVIQVKRESGKE